MTGSQKLKLALWVLPFVLLASVGGWVYLEFFTPTKVAVRQRLGEAEVKSQAAVTARLKKLNDLFDKGHNGSRAFADEVLSLNGKWELAKSLADGGESHRRYLASEFGKHVFTPDELQAAVESAVEGYLDDLEAVEGEMLVKLRADLATPGRSPESLSAALRSDEQFRREYRAMIDGVVKEIHADVAVLAGREVVNWIAADVAATAAVELGVSAGVIGAGAATGWATLGVGMVVGLILDSVIDLLFKAFGYDPAEKVQEVVRVSLIRMRDALVRQADAREGTKAGALRRRLEELHQKRTQLRNETLTRLMKKGDL